MYKIIEENAIDDKKRIEETFEQKRTFTLEEMKQEIEMYDNEITNLQARKKELEDKISAVTSELKLSAELIK